MILSDDSVLDAESHRLWDGTLRLIQSTSPESAEVAPLAAQS